MRLSTILLAGAVIAAGAAGVLATQQGWIGGPGGIAGPGEIAMDADDISGVVTGPAGPEAGVWVIAETSDLPTKYARIVVTDDQGRYLLPDLPAASYSVWVRGYGLVDSAKAAARPGQRLNLNATAAPDEKTAAQIYPALYWWAMLEIPEASNFPGTGTEGNGIPPVMQTQAHWVRTLKEGCYSCHQLGNKATRELPPGLGTFETTFDAWTRRIQSGQASGNMVRNMGNLDSQRALKLFADWTDRITHGELPTAKPERPKGVERNIVITEWDWGTEKGYLHDMITVDRRDPTKNPNGLIFGGPELSTDNVPVLDPVKNTASFVTAKWRDPNTPTSKTDPIFAPSPYWGDEAIWDSHTDIHNTMYDGENRQWLASRIRPNPNPDWCKAGSQHPSAKLYPMNTSYRQAAFYDPKSGEYQTINTCFSTQHLNFARDANNTLYYSPGFPIGGAVIGWLNTKLWLETKDEQKAQNWTPFILDTNGNGKRDEGYTEPGAPIDPAKDARVNAYPYGILPSPLDGSIWGSSLGMPGGLVRVSVDPDHPETALSEWYEVPFEATGAFDPRGMDIDKKGVVWSALHSGHLAAFDRSKCRGPLNGPNATGKHCPEGWTVYPLPGPQMKNYTGSGSADVPYYTWVDWSNTLGLGDDIPLIAGNAADALYALKDGQLVTLRVPYPLGYFVKAMDGRIDDANTGWKGRGLWTTYGNRTPFHLETGKGTKPKAVHMQIRPDPLAH
jgi:hypothetical protein